MANYYFLITLLPQLVFNKPLQIKFNEFKALLQNNLTKGDLRKTAVIRGYYDICNYRSMLKSERLTPFGNWDEEAFAEALDSRQLPSYWLAFIDRYGTKEERLNHFSQLLAAYYQAEIREASGFMKEYLVFEERLALVLASLRAKRWGKEFSAEGTFADEDLDPLFNQNNDEPLRLLQAVEEYRIQKVQDLEDKADPFAVNRLLAYMIKLICIEKWQSLSQAKGLIKLDTLLKEHP